MNDRENQIVDYYERVAQYRADREVAESQNMARGFAWGLLLAAPLWLFIGFVATLIVRTVS